jgi:hypothetical protein
MNELPTALQQLGTLTGYNQCRSPFKFVMLACHGLKHPRRTPMIKIAFVVAVAVLTIVPLVSPAKAQGVKMAQVYADRAAPR